MSKFLVLPAYCLDDVDLTPDIAVLGLNPALAKWILSHMRWGLAQSELDSSFTGAYFTAAYSPVFALCEDWSGKAELMDEEPDCQMFSGQLGTSMRVDGNGNAALYQYDWHANTEYLTDRITLAQMEEFARAL